MDLVRDFDSVFNSIKDNPVKDVKPLVDVIKKHSENQKPSSWRWDVMRSVVMDDIEYIKLVTTAELEHVFEEQKSDFLKVPYIINLMVMFLHTSYYNYKNLVDVIEINRRIMGEEIFEKIEEQMSDFLDLHYSNAVLGNHFENMSDLDFAKYIYKMYEEDYKNYYFWPQMKVAMERVISTL